MDSLLFPAVAIVGVVSVVLIGVLRDIQAVASVLLLVLAISPTAMDRLGLPGNDAQKGVLVVTAFLLMMRFGVRMWWPALLGAAVLTVAFFASFWEQSSGSVLGTQDIVRAFAGSALPLLFAVVNWRDIDARRWLLTLSWLAPFSIAAGIALQAAGIWTVLLSQYDGAVRLQGASIPPHLAMLGIGGFVAGTVIVMRYPVRRAWALLALNALIVIATLTRGAMICLVIVLAALALWAFFGSSLRHRIRTPLRALFAAVSVVALLFLPEIMARFGGNSFEGAVNTSGRDSAWPFYLSLTTDYEIWGRGLGFANLANAAYRPAGVQSAFEAPHNEYIHLFLDGGLVLVIGYWIVVVAMFLAALRVVESGLRMTLLGYLLGTAVYAYVDNVFSTPQYTVPLFIILSLLVQSKSLPELTRGVVQNQRKRLLA